MKIVPIILGLFHSQSVLDVGCGLGTWLSAFRQLGVADVIGIDGEYVDRDSLFIPRQLFRQHDLVAPLDLKRTFELVLSLEVAEHLPESAADTFVESLVRHGDIIVFSAAIPGQIGTHHVNEQYPSYWTRKFGERSFELFDIIRPIVWHDPDVALCYKQNVLAFVRNPSAAQQSLKAADQRALLLDVVHPEHYEHVQTFTANVGRLLSFSPSTYALAERVLIAARNLRHSS
jgi:SAM-dependent methyltransferase